MNIGERYVLTIADVFKGAESGKDKARVSGFDNLIFDDNGLSKLEKLEDVLQEVCDNARHEGYVQGREEEIKNLTEQAKKAYNDGLNHAWECAGKIMRGLTYDERNAIFSCTDQATLICLYTPSEITAKIKAYEEKRISKKESCHILDDKCPYMHLDCGDCEVYCSVHRALDRLKRMKGAE